MTALREKVRYERSEPGADGADKAASRTVTEADSDAKSGAPSPNGPIETSETDLSETAGSQQNGDHSPVDEGLDGAALDDSDEKSERDGKDTSERKAGETDQNSEGTEADDDEVTEIAAEEPDGAPGTLRAHSRTVIGDGTDRVRLLDEDFETISEADTESAFDLLEGSERVPFAVVVDGELSQRLLDVAAQRGVDHIVAASIGEFVKRPTSVRVRSADQLLAASEA